IPISIYIDLKSLYNYLIKLSITNKKRLIINIILIRELYKKREIIEIRYINSKDNPIDAYIKKMLNKVLETLILYNTLII
ncbi:hypothetical protein CC78DRAFT_471253, partial [Lojkania enalia]